MNPKEIIKRNNELREQLNNNNRTYYENMLTYIRLHSNKSEQYTEEVLLELLEHLLHAQSEGRTAKEVFGNNPEKYCQEIIGEIPREDPQKRIKFISFIALQFLAIISLTHGIIGFGLNFLFELGSEQTVFSLGSAIITIILDLLLLWLSVKLILKWLKGSSFAEKVTGKWSEIFQIWLISTCAISLFVTIPYLIPAFGPIIRIPTLSFAGIGLLLYLVSFAMNKRYRIT
ncbi:DUF1129 family protein [Virgibacillus kekensis]|uniref:DUF1129 family protein n=1 Tax=Virgibacillus kekensis TaxID=202261 RepID=A0ABV9DM10_9BACI